MYISAYYRFVCMYVSVLLCPVCLSPYVRTYVYYNLVCRSVRHPKAHATTHSSISLLIWSNIIHSLYRLTALSFSLSILSLTVYFQPSPIENLFLFNHYTVTLLFVLPPVFCWRARAPFKTMCFKRCAFVLQNARQNVNIQVGYIYNRHLLQRTKKKKQSRNDY